MEHTKHLWRALLLVLVFGLLFVLVTHFMVPETFGAEGFYRAASREEYMKLPAIHGASRKACAECHQKQQETHDKGKHAGVNCEVCHAPMADHVQDGKKVADMPKNTSYTACRLCHSKLEARPKTFPQVVIADHLREKEAIEAGERIPETFACTMCHPAHDPKLEK